MPTSTVPTPTMDGQTIDSPCISVCKLDPRGAYCIGCNRTRWEIGEWATATDDRKRAIIAAAKNRRDT